MVLRAGAAATMLERPPPTARLTLGAAATAALTTLGPTTGATATAAATAAGLVRLGGPVVGQSTGDQDTLAGSELLQQGVSGTGDPGRGRVDAGSAGQVRTSLTCWSVIIVMTVPAAPARAVRPERCR